MTEMIVIVILAVINYFIAVYLINHFLEDEKEEDDEL